MFNKSILSFALVTTLTCTSFAMKITQNGVVSLTNSTLRVLEKTLQADLSKYYKEDAPEVLEIGVQSELINSGGYNINDRWTDYRVEVTMLNTKGNDVCSKIQYELREDDTLVPVASFTNPKFTTKNLGITRFSCQEAVTDALERRLFGTVDVSIYTVLKAFAAETDKLRSNIVRVDQCDSSSYLRGQLNVSSCEIIEIEAGDSDGDCQ